MQRLTFLLADNGFTMVRATQTVQQRKSDGSQIVWQAWQHTSGAVVYHVITPEWECVCDQLQESSGQWVKAGGRL